MICSKACLAFRGELKVSVQFHKREKQRLFISKKPFAETRANSAKMQTDKLRAARVVAESNFFGILRSM